MGDVTLVTYIHHCSLVCLLASGLLPGLLSFTLDPITSHFCTGYGPRPLAAIPDVAFIISDLHPPQLPLCSSSFPAGSLSGHPHLICHLPRLPQPPGLPIQPPHLPSSIQESPSTFSTRCWFTFPPSLEF